MSARYTRRRGSLLGRQSIQDGGSDSETPNDSHPIPYDAGSQSSAPPDRGTLANLSASFNQRILGRSLGHHASTGHLHDTAQYSSHGIREQTAALASLALEDALSVRSDTSPYRTSSSRFDSASHHHEDPDSTIAGIAEIVDARNRHDASALPEVIEESSEPVSPSEMPIASSAKSSGLSSLFKKSNARRPSIESPASKIHYGGQNLANIEASGEAEHVSRASERTPLLPKRQVSGTPAHKRVGSVQDPEIQLEYIRKKGNHFQQMLSSIRYHASSISRIATSPKSWDAKAVWEQGIRQPVFYLPAVFLGLLLNILDGLSYGMILFPLGDPIFENTGPDGLSMFYISCIISQLTYSLGGSIFRGAIGSELIEVVPFFHKMAFIIIAEMGRDDPHAIMATVIVSYALSSMLTGIVFFLLGALRLGSLVDFFPGHILKGCIGGVGFFLFVTGIEVSARLDGNLSYNLATLNELLRPEKLMLWLPPLGLAILLQILKHLPFLKDSNYVLPAYIISVAAIFYILVAAIGPLNMDLLRDRGFVFDKVQAGVPWYHFYSYYDFEAVDWKAIGKTVPAMFALTFFGVINVPINVPLLAIQAQEDDYSFNRELVAHGISNALSSVFGTIQNYLVYVNSVIFYDSGADSRVAGLMLAGATFGVLIAGPEMIGYVPILVVAALIYWLGIDLLKEALWDTFAKLTKLEYFTVIAIVLIMGMYDFVQGIFAGIILACLNYVVQTSQISAIRARFTGEVVASTVRRNPVDRTFLHEVGNQICVMKLMGNLFFGSIVAVEKSCRALIDEEAFAQRPIRYLVIDVHHVSGIDYSAGEAFVRMQRVLGRKDVKMIFSGVEKGDEVGKALQRIGLWGASTTVDFNDISSVGFFENLNDALEKCENEQLETFHERRDAPSVTGDTPKSSLDVPKREELLQPLDMVFGSPRQQGLRQAAKTTLDEHVLTKNSKKWINFQQPLKLILQTFADYTDKNEDFWFQVTQSFKRLEFTQGAILYNRGDTPDGFYLLEAGTLRADYDLIQGQYHEVIVAGTTCGELPFFSETLRTATVIAEQDCVAWLIDREGWERLQQEKGDVAQELLKIAIKLTNERMTSITNYVLTAAG